MPATGNYIAPGAAAARTITGAAAPAPVAAPTVAPTAQAASVYTDPTVLAFLRSSGLAEQTAAADVARRQAAINQALEGNLADLGAQGQIARRNIAGGMEARGVFRSGQNLQAQGEQEAQQARQQSALMQQARNNVNDLSGSLAQQVANNQVRAAELGTTATQNAALAAGKGAADSTYGSAGVNGQPADTSEPDTYSTTGA